MMSLSLQNLRSRLQNHIQECNKENTNPLADQTVLLNEVEQKGNKPEDWLGLLNRMEEQMRGVADNDTIKCTYMSNLYARAMKAIPAELGKNNLAYAQIMISCANFKSTYNPEDARSMFSHARYFARKFALVHVALAQFELTQGNKDKAARVLQKAKEMGAQPNAMLGAAYRNLMLNHQEILPDEEKQQFLNDTGKSCERNSELSYQDTVTNLNESKQWDTTVELLRPKLSHRLSSQNGSLSSRQNGSNDSRDSGYSGQNGDGSDEPPEMPKLCTDIIRHNSTCAESGCDDSLSGVFPMPYKTPSQPQFTKSHFQHSTVSSSRTKLLRPVDNILLSTSPRDAYSSHDADSTVNFLLDKHKHKIAPQNPNVGKESVVATDEVGLKPVETHGVRALRYCHSTPDCKNASLLSARPSTERRRFEGKPRRVPIKRCSLPQLDEHCRMRESDEDDTDGVVKLPPMPDEEIDTTTVQDTTIACQSETCEDAMDTQSTSNSVFTVADGSRTGDPDCNTASKTYTSLQAESESRMDTEPGASIANLSLRATNSGAVHSMNTYSKQDKLSLQTELQGQPQQQAQLQPPQQQQAQLQPPQQQQAQLQPPQQQQTQLQPPEQQQAQLQPPQQQQAQLQPPQQQQAQLQPPQQQQAQLQPPQQQQAQLQPPQQQQAQLQPPQQQQAQLQPPQQQQAQLQPQQLYQQQMHLQQQQLYQQQQQQQMPLPQTPQQTGMRPDLYHHGLPPMSLLYTPVGKQGEMLAINGKMYKVVKLIGRGGTSKVYEVLDPDSNLRAVKRVSLDGADETTVNSYCNEIRLLKRLQYSDKIIKMFDFEYNKEHRLLYVVMERGDTDLASFFRTRNKQGSLSGRLRKFYWWLEMLEAVNVLHKEGIVHSDLKPANFLLVAGNLKLIDFGIAKALQQDMTSITLDQQVGTLNYMSPEAIMDTHHGTNIDENGCCKPRLKIGVKSDVWSLGCILYNLVYGKTPFQQISNQLLKLQAIVNPGYVIEFPPIHDTYMLETVKKCLIRDPRERPSIDELLNDPYVREQLGP